MDDGLIFSSSGRKFDSFLFLICLEDLGSIRDVLVDQNSLDFIQFFGKLVNILC